MPNTPPNVIAGGDIRPFRFVTWDTAEDHQVLESNSGDTKLAGICGGSTRRAEISDVVVTTLHAADGEHVRLYSQGDITLLELGGTITAGDYLKPDADGKGVVATLATDPIGAQALQSGTSGGRIEVEVKFIR
jgi:hypothetical protein